MIRNSLLNINILGYAVKLLFLSCILSDDRQINLFRDYNAKTCKY